MNCPICLNPATARAFTGSDNLFETTTRKFDLSVCSKCDCLFLNPQPGPEEISAFYPTQYWWNASRPSLLKRLESIYRRVALRDHIAFITKASHRHKRPVRLLDVGCGNGTLIGLLKRRGFQVLGVDTSEEASAVAKLESGVEVVVGQLTDASLAGGAFDIVTLFHVMEHVTNPREVLREVCRLLKGDGTLVLQVPNIDSWQFRWFGANWYGLDVPRHVIDYSRRAIVALIEEEGFTVQRVRQFNLRDNAPALISSLFPSLDPLSRPIRLRQRNRTESLLISWLKHLTYFLLILVALPVAILEAASGYGATVMIEAHRK